MSQQSDDKTLLKKKQIKAFVKFQFTCWRGFSSRALMTSGLEHGQSRLNCNCIQRLVRGEIRSAASQTYFKAYFQFDAVASSASGPVTTGCKCIFILEVSLPSESAEMNLTLTSPPCRL